MDDPPRACWHRAVPDLILDPPPSSPGRFRLREATLADAPALLAIYAPFIEESAISFETEVPTPAAFAERIFAIQQKWPYLVAVTDAPTGERVLGYAYASSHRDRAAYRFSAEVSAYVDPAAHRLGIARALYTAVLELLRHQHIVNVYAGIALPNEKSVGFHEALGFRLLGVYRHVGYKMGAWHDVGWWEQSLVDEELLAAGHLPEEPVFAPTLRTSPIWTEVLARASEGGARVSAPAASARTG